MKSLFVGVNYSLAAGFPGVAAQWSPLALPIDVLDSEGGLVARGVANASTPATLDVSNATGRLFVRLTWPSGKTQIKIVDDTSESTRALVFDDSGIATSEWSAWAEPRLRRGSSIARGGTQSIGKFDRVWLRLWYRADGQWMARPLSLSKVATYHSDMARQLDLDLGVGSWLLQLGGLAVPWRFVALPGGGACRVLITPNASTDPRADPLKVVVTSFRLNAETLLEFLARDAIRSASALAAFQPLAQQLVEEKVSDPISAMAGAYFSLRTNGWYKIPVPWFDNLDTLFPWLADGAIIRLTVSIRQGFTQRQGRATAQGRLRDCVHRGLPLFAEGLSLLKEAAAVLRGKRGPDAEPFAYIESLAAADAWAGSALSFYGELPDRPSPKLRFGLPDDSSSASLLALPHAVRTRLRRQVGHHQPRRPVGTASAGGAGSFRAGSAGAGSLAMSPMAGDRSSVKSEGVTPRRRRKARAGAEQVALRTSGLVFLSDLS